LHRKKGIFVLIPLLIIVEKKKVADVQMQN